MSTLGFIEYENAGPEVRAVYDDIKATRKIDKDEFLEGAGSRSGPPEAYLGRHQRDHGRRRA